MGAATSASGHEIRRGGPSCFFRGPQCISRPSGTDHTTRNPSLGWGTFSEIAPRVGTIGVEKHLTLEWEMAGCVA